MFIHQRKNGITHTGLSCLLLSLTLLGGCSSTHFKDVLASPKERHQWEGDDEERLKIAYLARTLAEPNARAQIEAKVHQSEFVRQWEGHDYATATSMVTDVAVGQLGSSMGSYLGAGVFALSLLSGDGSSKIVSQVYLPRQWQGKELETTEQAQEAMRELVRSRLSMVAERLGSQLECVARCDTFQPDYRIPLPPEPPHPGFGYWPAEVLIFPHYGKMIEVKESDPLSAILGFPVAWRPDLGQTFRLQGRVADDAGEPIEPLQSSSGYGRYIPFEGDLENVALGQAILQALTFDNHWVLGNGIGSPSLVYLDGKVYGFIVNGSADLIRFKVVTETLPETGHTEIARQE